MPAIPTATLAIGAIRLIILTGVTGLRSVQPRAQVNGNTIRVIVVMPLMVIATSATGWNKLAIVLLKVQVIGRRSFQEPTQAISQVEVTRRAQPVAAALGRARDRRTLALPIAWAIASHPTGPMAHAAAPSGRPMEISRALSAVAALKVWARRVASVAVHRVV